MSVDFIRANKSEILALEKNWGIKIRRSGFCGDMLGLYSRTESFPMDYRYRGSLHQATRKTQENIAVSDITDWTFAKKANEELKR
jgi:hypothetical protein